MTITLILLFIVALINIIQLIYIHHLKIVVKQLDDDYTAEIDAHLDTQDKLNDLEAIHANDRASDRAYIKHIEAHLMKHDSTDPDCMCGTTKCHNYIPPVNAMGIDESGVQYNDSSLTTAKLNNLFPGDSSIDP